jgi:hypothetical protein
MNTPLQKSFPCSKIRRKNIYPTSIAISNDLDSMKNNFDPPIATRMGPKNTGPSLGGPPKVAV